MTYVTCHGTVKKTQRMTDLLEGRKEKGESVVIEKSVGSCHFFFHRHGMEFTTSYVEVIFTLRSRQ